jgi:hypothetical protein
MPNCLHSQRAGHTSHYRVGQAYDGHYKPQCGEEESERLINGKAMTTPTGAIGELLSSVGGQVIHSAYADGCSKHYPGSEPLEGDGDVR